MRRVCLFAMVLLSALAAATPALALPHFGKAQNRQISTLVTRWIDDMVRRRNLADGWTISGTEERGGLSRQQWISGREVPVQKIDVLNDPRTAWYAKWKSDGEIGLVLSLRTGHGKNAEMWQAETVLAKQHGRWVVDGFYVDGIFRLGAGHSGSCVSSKCKVTGLADYAPAGAGGVASVHPRIDSHVFVAIVSGVGGLALLTSFAIVLHLRRRDRRAREAYYASRIL